MTIKEHCRACKSPMRDVLSLGDIVPVDFVAPGESVRPAEPLTLAECESSGCGLVQLRHTLHRDSLFRRYWYESGLNASMVSSLQDVIDGIRKRVSLEPGDVVIDIGANDGTLLGLYGAGVLRIGFDPALNLASAASSTCDRFINDYFETSEVDLPKAKVITSIAMFYDLDEPRAFVARIADVLCPDGIWVMQMTDLVRMLRANAFDNICHEHLCYYPLRVFVSMVEEYGLEVFDVEFNDVNGASVRAYVGKRGARTVETTVAAALADEYAYLADDAIGKFAKHVEDAKTKIVGFVRTELAAGKRIHAMGASTKGNTLLQYFGLSNAEITVAAEVNRAKLGLRMGGSDVPIVSQQESLDAAPDYYLVLPWHFINFFLAKQADYLSKGGALITPLPIPRVYGHEARDL